MQVRESLDKGEYIDLWSQQGAHILQSYQWGELRSSSWQVRRLVVDDRFVVTINIRKLPLIGRYGYISKLLLPPATDWRALLESISRYANQHLQIDVLLIDPAWHKDQYRLPEWVKLAKPWQPQYTNWVWLKSKTDTQLWQELKSGYRRNIKKAVSHNIEIEVIEKGDGIVQFYSLMQQVAVSAGFRLQPLAYFQRMWQLLSLEQLARIYLAKYNNEVVGGYLVLFDSVNAYELYGGVTLLGRDTEAGYALKWESIKDAATLGKEYYDQWGSAPKLNSRYDPRHKLANIADFKAGFGGEDIEFEQQLQLIFSSKIYYYFLIMQKSKEVYFVVLPLIKQLVSRSRRLFSQLRQRLQALVRRLGKAK